MTEERWRHPPQPWGPVEKGGEEESAFTLEPPPFTRTGLSEGTHTYRRAHIRGTRGAFQMQSACLGDTRP